MFGICLCNPSELLKQNYKTAGETEQEKDLEVVRKRVFDRRLKACMLTTSKEMNEHAACLMKTMNEIKASADLINAFIREFSLVGGQKKNWQMPRNTNVVSTTLAPRRGMCENNK